MDKEKIEAIQALALTFLLGCSGLWFLVQSLGIVFAPSHDEVTHCRLADIGGVDENK